MEFPIVRKRGETAPALAAIRSMRDLVRDLLQENIWDWAEMEPFFLDRMRGVWIPKIDMAESDAEVVMRINVPGVDPKDISVETGDRTLTVSGKSEEDREEKGETWYRAEREKGEFRRTITLPEGVDVAKIRAHAKHGIIEISIPKKPEMQVKKKKVEVVEE